MVQTMNVSNRLLTGSLRFMRRKKRSENVSSVSVEGCEHFRDPC